MKVEKLMSKPVVCVQMDDSLKRINEIFSKANFHHLVVIEAEKIFGVISDRDLLRALSPNIGTAAETERDLATLSKKAHQILTRKPITLSPDADVFAAINIFNENRISCIPIVDEEDRPVGMLSWRDILKYIGDRQKNKMEDSDD